MPFGDGTGPWWGRGYGFGRGWGRGPGYWATGSPGWARGWPRGYCWYYYQQTGQFPSWSPWSAAYTPGVQPNQNQTTQPPVLPGQQPNPQPNIDYLESLKKELETELKTIENQINQLRSRKTGDK